MEVGKIYSQNLVINVNLPKAHTCNNLFPNSEDEESPTWSAYVGKMFTAASTYLPTQVSDMMHQDRAFATVRLNMFGLKNICALAM